MSDATGRQAPLRPVHMGPVGVDIERHADGSLLLRHPSPLQAYPDTLIERLVHWASVRPDQLFLSMRHADGAVSSLTWAQAHGAARAVGQALLDRGLSLTRPVAVLSENDLPYAILVLAALYVGVPLVPVSPNYSLLSKDFGKLRHVMAQVRSGLVYAGDGERYAAALMQGVGHDALHVVARRGGGAEAAVLFDDLLATEPTDAVDAARAAVGPDTIAKILFTSGSTGTPKGVVFPHRMLSSNQQQQAQTLAFLQDEPPVLVDWLPWHHTFGGNSNFGMALYNGGTLHIDRGRPLPGQIEPTVRLLREVAPTFYLNVPKGFEALLPYLRDERALRERFFSRLRMIQYGAANLPHHIWDALDALAVQTCGERILITGGLGSTECGSLTMYANWEPRGRTNTAGLPVPGMDVKLVPAGNKLEVRVRGPSVLPGYWNDSGPADAWDEQGWFRTFDAVRFVDPADPCQGFCFDGRIVDDFKLDSGTWVNVGALRAAAIATFAPLAADLVITGEGRGEVGAIVFPDIAACRALDAALPADAGAAQVVASAAVHAAFGARLAAMRRTSTGTASRIERIVLEHEPATPDSGELADKGTVSQQAVLGRRAAVVEELHRREPPARVIEAKSSEKFSRG